jgi:hypothetical protein
MAQRRRENRPAKWHHSPAGLKYNVRGDGMSPLCIGLAAAEFLPANPELWVEAALDARLRFARHRDGIACETDNDPRRNFLVGWLCGTPGGKEAVNAYMAARGIGIVAVDGAEPC